MNRAELQNLVDNAGFIFRGKVVPSGPAEPLKLGAAQTLSTIEVEEVLRSTEALKGSDGQKLAYLNDESGPPEEGGSFVFLTDVVSLGDRIIVRGRRVKASSETNEAVADSIRRADEMPLRRRIAEADAVVVGRVLSSHQVEPPPLHRSEHDPDWWVSRIAVESVLKGGKIAGEIDVLFANSTDIAWYKAPKLHEGVYGVMLLHRVAAEDRAPKASKARYKVIDPLDYHPIERASHVERLCGEEKEGR